MLMYCVSFNLDIDTLCLSCLRLSLLNVCIKWNWVENKQSKWKCNRTQIK